MKIETEGYGGFVGFETQVEAFEFEDRAVDELFVCLGRADATLSATGHGMFLDGTREKRDAGREVTI